MAPKKESRTNDMTEGDSAGRATSVRMVSVVSE